MATITQGEHTFNSEVLVSGEKIHSFTAGEALTAGEPVYLSGDEQVSASSADGGEFIGVALYDVASGEEIAVAGDDCKVKVEVSEAVSANDVILPDGLGTFETVATSAASDGVAIVTNGAASGEICTAYIFSNQGATA